MKLLKRIEKGPYSDAAFRLTGEEHDINLQLIEDAINSLGVNGSVTKADCWNTTGMEIMAYANNYPLQGQILNAPIQKKPVNPADDTYDRQDAVVADINENIIVIPGTASPVVAPPYIDTDLYFLIKYISIPANATAPEDINTGPQTTLKTLYAESGTEVGGESNVSTVATSVFEILSNDNPLSGSVSIEATNAKPLDELIFQHSTLQSVADATHLYLEIQLKEEALYSEYWFLRFIKNSALIRSKLFKHGDYGFDAGSTEKQIIVIPKEDIDIPNEEYQIMKLFFLHSAPTFSGYRIDNVKWINSFGTTPDYNVVVKPNSVGYAELKPELKAVYTVASYVIDWNSGSAGLKTFTGTPVVVFTETNVPSSSINKTITVEMTGAVTSIAFPSNYKKAVNASEDYDGTKRNVYVFDYVNGNVYYSNTLFPL